VHNAINWWDLANKEAPALGWYLLTFLIFLGLVIHFVRKPLRAFLEARSSDVRTAIEEAKKAKEQAQKQMAEFERKVAALDEEIAQMRKEFISRGEAERAAFEKSTAQMAQQITKEAEDNLLFDSRHALLTLKTDMAEAVIAKAKAELESAKDRSTESALKGVFNKGVRELHN